MLRVLDSLNLDEEEKDGPQSLDLRGYIGKYPITMHLDIEGEKVSGSYHYNQGSSDLQLTGSLKENHIEINETTQEGRPTGHLDGVKDGDAI